MSADLSLSQTPQKIGYARVSTKGQKLASQINALKEAGCDPIFKDKGVSGKIFPRKGLSQALKALKRGDMLVVHKLDRLGRTVLGLAQLQEQFEARGINLCSLTQSLDMSTASGRLTFYILAAFAQFESDINAERTKGGIKARRSKGKRLGRKPKLSPEQIMAAREMLKNPGMSLTTVAALFRVAPNTIRRGVNRLQEVA